MEPPSSIHTNLDGMTGPRSDDPLSRRFPDLAYSTPLSPERMESGMTACMTLSAKDGRGLPELFWKRIV